MSSPSASSAVRLAAETWESLFRSQVAVMRKLQAGPAFKSLPVKEYDVLFTLSRCPSGQLRLNEINDKVLLSQSSLSRLVDRLEKRGLVERTTAPRRRPWSAAVPHRIRQRVAENNWSRTCARYCPNSSGRRLQSRSSGSCCG